MTNPKPRAWVLPEEIEDDPLRAACRVALGDPDVLGGWMEGEIDDVRRTIAAYLNATVNGAAARS